MIDLYTCERVNKLMEHAGLLAVPLASCELRGDARPTSAHLAVPGAAGCTVAPRNISVQGSAR